MESVLIPLQLIIAFILPLVIVVTCGRKKEVSEATYMVITTPEPASESDRNDFEGLFILSRILKLSNFQENIIITTNTSAENRKKKTPKSVN